MKKLLVAIAVVIVGFLSVWLAKQGDDQVVPTPTPKASPSASFVPDGK